MKNNEVSITEPKSIEMLNIAGGIYRILVSGKETGGEYTVIEMNVPPGGGPGPHAHKNMHESFYVAEGEIEFRAKGIKQVAGAGASVFIPKGGAVHSFRNTSDKPAKLICTAVPAGLDEMFIEISQSYKSAIPAIMKKYGNEFFPTDYLS